eukprot:scaffold34660_cov175-Amphora_coffeaeformis.AAC.4
MGSSPVELIFFCFLWGSDGTFCKLVVQGRRLCWTMTRVLVPSLSDPSFFPCCCICDDGVLKINGFRDTSDSRDALIIREPATKSRVTKIRSVMTLVRA